MVKIMQQYLLISPDFYIVILALMFWCIDKRYGYKLSFTLLFSGMLNSVVKHLAHTKIDRHGRRLQPTC